MDKTQRLRLSTFYRFSPTSNSPRSNVASLLAERTVRYDRLVNAVWMTGENDLLIGSLGWKSTAVTVPLCPGS